VPEGSAFKTGAKARGDNAGNSIQETGHCSPLAYNAVEKRQVPRTSGKRREGVKGGAAGEKGVQDKVWPMGVQLKPNKRVKRQRELAQKPPNPSRHSKRCEKRPRVNAEGKVNLGGQPLRFPKEKGPLPGLGGTAGKKGRRKEGIPKNNQPRRNASIRGFKDNKGVVHPANWLKQRTTQKLPLYKMNDGPPTLKITKPERYVSDRDKKWACQAQS